MLVKSVSLKSLSLMGNKVADQGVKSLCDAFLKALTLHPAEANVSGTSVHSALSSLVTGAGGRRELADA